MRYQFITPSLAADWAAYHEIRRHVLFEMRGVKAAYEDNHPDDQLPDHHAKLLVVDDVPVGVVRIDISKSCATLRRVAIRSDAQRLGHGRRMLDFALDFARDNDCTMVDSHVAHDAVGFYEKCGFFVEPMRQADAASVYMILLL